MPLPEEPIGEAWNDSKNAANMHVRSVGMCIWVFTVREMDSS
jgi:hypothetical protein